MTDHSRTDVALPASHNSIPVLPRWTIQTVILACAGIGIHLLLRAFFPTSELVVGLRQDDVPLVIVLLFGGLPQVFELIRKALRGEFGSDLLAAISIVTSVLLGEFLAGALVVLMLSGGMALEAYAVRRASSVLSALANRMPTLAHRRDAAGVVDVALQQIQPGDQLQIFPHEICPVDGTVVEGHGVMDESYLTGEPYQMSKAPGTPVFSGAINGESALLVRAEKRSIDSRYSRIMQVMHDSEQKRPHMRRLADQLGAWYTPLALFIAILAGLIAQTPTRFLSVLVVATPCPLLIAIPVALIGAISLAARRGIIIKDPTVLEQIGLCRTAIFDKTGTLTYGEPSLTEIVIPSGANRERLLQQVASLERYSKHPLSAAILQSAQESQLPLLNVTEIRERPGEGLLGVIDGETIQVTSRKKLVGRLSNLAAEIPEAIGGLECVVLRNSEYAGLIRFRDTPRPEGKSFVGHLGPSHQFHKVMLVSGDRQSEVQHLADLVGIRDVYFSQTPEQKLEIVRNETKIAPTLFMGDGINDAPALTAATVGIAFGQNSEITSEAAGAVVLDSSLTRVDELFHMSTRMRNIALTSAIGGMALSIFGMGLAAFGILTPVAGAIVQEAIDVLAVVNALRVAIPPKGLSDLGTSATST